MSLLLDALKNAENAKNRADNDSGDNPEHKSDDNFVVSPVDADVDASAQGEQTVDLESAADQSSNYVADSEDAKIETASLEKPDDMGTDPCAQDNKFAGIDRRNDSSPVTESDDHDSEELNQVALDRPEPPTSNDIVEPIAPAETQLETESPVVDEDEDHAQNNDQEKNTLDWELPPDATETTIAPVEQQTKDFSISPDPQGANKPEFMHFAGAKPEGNSRTLLLILFIFIGTAIGTVLLYYLNQASAKKPLFTSSVSAEPHKHAAIKKPTPGNPNKHSNPANAKSPVIIDKSIVHTNAPLKTNTSKAIDTDLDSNSTSPVKPSVETNNTAVPVTKPKPRLSSLDPLKGETGEGDTSLPGSASITKIQRDPGVTENLKTIRIVKHKARSQVSARLSSAYRHYQKGQMLKARTLYQKILNSNDKSRDAMLGLAAIAIHFRQTARAVSYYKALLTLNPQDHAAITGLLSLNRDSDRAHSLSTVKQLIKQRNASASLFFLLGNLHAANRNWPEAQGAYFEAWNRDNSNADYAYNLAISLDSLNRRASALTYYKTAMELSNKSTARFDRNELRRRIRELSGIPSRGRL